MTEYVKHSEPLNLDNGLMNARKLRGKTTNETDLEYWEHILEELPKYPTPLLSHAMGYVKAKIEQLKGKQ